MANMSDRTNIVAPTMDFWLHAGSALTAPTQPLHLRLMTAQGSNTSNGTELSATGYTAGGSTMGSPSFGANSAGVSASNNAVSWTAGAAWSAVVAAEVWDTAATPKRLLQGAVTSFTLANGNTVNFAAGAITADGSQW
jgi:hypothetical protein